MRSLLDWFEDKWSDVTVPRAFVKVSLWSWARKSEASGLRWSDVRRTGDECHFKSVGKWAVVKWFRIPKALREGLESIRCESEFVFGDYPRQLVFHHERHINPSVARRVKPEFDPYNLGDWMYRQMVEWSKGRENGHAYL
ncbi:hypothetical protein OAK47_02635 [Planctomycetaceae bacterium]|nr:hypothetical protein [bacterium]MDC0262099.1 hypothetical protein [Planctomycetaceae bacterium]MDG2387692.1 hypothetical protein [Planctomycetaceae bacterium]